MSEASSQERGNKNYTIAGSYIQAVQGEDNIVGQQTQNISKEEELSEGQVVELLGRIEEIIYSSSLPNPTKETAINRLKVAADEVREKEPDRQLAAGNLKRMTETLVEASKTTEAGKKVWDSIQPLLLPIAGWCRVGVEFLLNRLSGG